MLKKNDLNLKIDPSEIGFDIDGVISDIMSLFINIAKNEYDINWIKYEDIKCYFLYECLDLDHKIIDSIIEKLLKKSYNSKLKPIDGAGNVLAKLSKHKPILFVTARTTSDAITEWIINTFSLEASNLEIIATGSFEGKKSILLDRNIKYFVEDRLETCIYLNEFGITPILFKQPWNRKKHNFIEVNNWREIEQLIKL